MHLSSLRRASGDPSKSCEPNYAKLEFTTIGINVDKVKAALGDLPMPANVWDLLFKPEYVSRLHRCGV